MPKGIYDHSKSKPQPRRKFFHDKLWIENEYLHKEKGSSTIAKELGMSVASIQYWLKRFNIPFRDMNAKVYLLKRKKLSETRRKYKITKEYLIENYVGRKKTLNQIAQEFGCSWDTIRKYINRFDLPMRNQSRKYKSSYKRTTTIIRQFQKKLLNLYGYKCAICGYDKFVNAHHIEQWSKRQDNSAKNGIVLCPNHHAEADYGLITKNELRKYQINEQEKVRHSK